MAPGAIFGCPAHDQRDLDFANAYGLPVQPVVLPNDEDASGFTVTDTAYTGPGKRCLIHVTGTDLIMKPEKKQRLRRLP